MFPLWLFGGCAADPARDADGDGFPAAEDCDDDDPGVFPGADDAPNDGIDGDCDGFDLASESLASFERIEPDVTTAHLQLGHDLRVADVDGDGIEDILAGSQQVYELADGQEFERGEAWLFAGESLEPLRRWVGAPVGGQLLGQFVAVAVGPDGASQLVLGSLEGAWVVAPDTPDGYPGGDGALLDSEADGYIFGNYVGAADLLGSAHQEIVTACGLDDSTWLAAVCIHEGPVIESVPVGDAAIIIDGPGDFGTSFADVDFDGDGAPDLGVGDDETGEERGQVSVVSGPLAPGHYGVDIVDQQWDGESAGDWFGHTLFPGDLDGDGQDELLAGAMAWPGGDRRGRLYALTPEVGDVADAPLIVDGDPGLQHLGVGAAVADLDGDGAADLAVGSPGLAAIAPTVRGRVLVFYGPLSGHLSSADAGRVFSGASPGDQAGWTVRAGEVTGDGVVDLVVAAPLASGVQPEMGQLYVLPGPLAP